MGWCPPAHGSAHLKNDRIFKHFVGTVGYMGTIRSQFYKSGEA